MVNLSGRELQTYEALYKHQGARIMFNCDKVTYQGIIDAILPDIRQVKMRHLKILDGDHYMGSNLRFRFSELTSFKVVESSESVNKYPRNDYLLNILRNNRPERSEIIAKALYGDKISDESDDENNDEKIEEKFVLDLPEHLEQQLAKDYAVIDSVEEDFHRALQSIASQEVVGVSFHGQKISRFGKLTWVCVSTEVSSYLFDIQQLGKEAFDSGLRDMLESKYLKKVIHDCSFASDCLAHQYSTFLSNVFDTRVADFVISMQRYSEKYKIHSYTSLDSCLRIYLQVPQEFLFQRETCQANETKRPITNAHLYDLLKSVLYLKLLQEKLHQELLTPFHRAVGFSRTILADSDQPLIDLVGSDLSRPDQIPQSLLMNGIQTARFQKPYKMENLSLRCTFIHPKTGHVIKPDLGTPAAAKNALLLNGQKNPIHETAKQEKDPSLTHGVSKASTKPCLGPAAALKNFLRLNEERKKALTENRVVNEIREPSKQEGNPSLANGVSKALCDPCENSTSDVKRVYLSERPSFRQMDEVYHKLANRKCPDQSETSVSAKPSVHFISRFTGKKSVSSSSNTHLDLSNKMCGKSADLNASSDNSSQSSYNNSECSDVWLKLREEVLAEKANSQYAHYSDQKIQFLPG